MLPDEVREAVDAVERSLCANYLPSAPVLAQWQTIRAHLLAREAEVERLRRELVVTRDCCRNVADEFAKQRDRAERAEALLREARHRLLVLNEDRQAACISGLTDRITAHLSENSRG